MIFNQEMECMPVSERKALQFFRLKNVIRKCYEKVPCYKKKFDEKGITPDDIQSLEDIRKLPFTSKYDLRDNYPFGMFAVPMEDVVRVHASSGTTGKPVVVGYTKQDIETWSELMARTLCCAGGTNHDIVQVAYGYGLFTGGLGAHYGVETLGSNRCPHVRRKHPAPNYTAAGFWFYYYRLHAIVLVVYCRSLRRNGGRYQNSQT